MSGFVIQDITLENAREEGLFCIKNPRNEGFRLKLEWLGKRLREGLRFKLLKAGGKAAGFIEYVPGEKAWRPVSAAGYMFIHCLWVYPNKFLRQGYASALISSSIEDAREAGMAGVAVVASEGSWLAGPRVFEVNGFETLARKGRFILMARNFSPGPPVAFRDWEQEASKYQGLHLVFANQCPLFIRSVDEMRNTARTFGLDLQVERIESPEEAQRSPSGFGVYTLLLDGRVLADHYISNARFTNILKKELQ